MALFDRAIPLVLKHEGGYVNNPNDPGGATNYGISLRFLKDHPNVGDFNHDGHVTSSDIRMMTIDQAKMLYKMFWWDQFHYDQINDQTIATKVFDFAINMGSKRAHMLLQQALNTAFHLKLVVDGIIGPTTRGVINAIHDGGEEQILLDAYCNATWAFYQSLAAANPKYRVFLKGWKNRAFDINKANEIT